MREALEHYMAFLIPGELEAGMLEHIVNVAVDYQGLDAAVALLEKTIQENPGHAQPFLAFVRMTLTYANEQNGLGEKAAQVVEEALKRFAGNASVYEAAVRLHLAHGARDRAAAVIEVAGKQAVKEPSFWLGIGRMALEVWPLADAENRPVYLAKVNPFFEKALKLATKANNDDAALQAVDFYLFSHQMDRAIEASAEMVRQNGNLEARKRLVRLYDAVERRGEAQEALRELVEAYPNDVEHRKLLAGLYVDQMEFDKAVEQLEAVLQIGGGDVNEYLMVSDLLRRSRQVDKFDRFTARAQQLYPREPRLGFMRALAHTAQKRYHAAADLFAQVADEAETTAPDMLDDSYHFNWGVALERGGRYDEAARQFDRSIQLTPPDNLTRAANTMNYLGYMWLEQNAKLDKAEQLIRKANELEQNNPAFVDSLGWLYFKQGKNQEALKELLRAEALMKELTPEDAEILDHIAQAYERVGDEVKAREYWQRTLDLNPPQKEIRQRAEKALHHNPVKPPAASQEEQEPAAKAP